MGPSTNATTFEPINTISAYEESPQPIGEGVESKVLRPDSTPTQNAPKAMPIAAPKHERWNFRDNLLYKDKWIGWDGPVWCNRYGRFENKAQTSEDDKPTSDSPAAHQNPESHQIHRCKREGCACRVPVQHHSYVKDIQRRIEPMTVSLVALEHQVGKLVHHIVKDGEQAVLDAFNHEDGKERFAMHSADRQQADGLMHEHFKNQHISMAETIANLEGRVHSLTHQLHVLMKQNDELIRNSQAGPGEHHYWQAPQ